MSEPMKENASNLVLIYVKLPLCCNDSEVLSEETIAKSSVERIHNHLTAGLDECLNGADNSNLVKLGEGVFIADENACYPVILKVLAWCERYRFECSIAPISDSALTLSLPRPELKAFLEAKRQEFRVTQFQTPTQPRTP